MSSPLFLLKVDPCVSVYLTLRNYFAITVPKRWRAGDENSVWTPYFVMALAILRLGVWGAAMTLGRFFTEPSLKLTDGPCWRGAFQINLLSAQIYTLYAII